MLLLANSAAADIYSYTDDSGALHFSNVPADSRYRLYFPEPRAAGGPQYDSAAARAKSLPVLNERPWSAIINKLARANQLEPALIHAVIVAESGYNPRALSRKGAMGLMQIMPATAQRYRVADPYDPRQNIEAGARHLRNLLVLFNQNLELALAAYNAGEEAVLKHGRAIPPYVETRQYVPKVIDLYRAYQST
jgi:soluble lytic murein transglycosylase-like protein